MDIGTTTLASCLYGPDGTLQMCIRDSNHPFPFSPFRLFRGPRRGGACSQKHLDALAISRQKYTPCRRLVPGVRSRSSRPSSSSSRRCTLPAHQSSVRAAAASRDVYKRQVQHIRGRPGHVHHYSAVAVLPGHALQQHMLLFKRIGRRRFLLLKLQDIGSCLLYTSRCV